MRLLTTTITLAALLLSGAAGAAPGKETTSKGGSGPSAGPSGGASEGGGSLVEHDPTRPDGVGPDAVNPDKEKPKSWEVSVSWEYHHLIVQSDLEGVGANKNLNYFSAYARWDPTKYDRLQITGGLYERFLADSGESGVRLDDTVLSYTRLIPLPREVNLRARFSLYLPTSFDSQLASLIVAPRLTIMAEKSFGHFSLDARLYGDLYIDKYATYQGGDPNLRAKIAGLVEASYSMPFLESLSIGASAFTGYQWYYDVADVKNPGFTTYGTVMQAGQPIQQEYGGEVFVRYNFPSVVGIKSDLTIALADGDPALGYSSVIHDGVQHIYAAFRQTAQVYGVLSARY